MPIMDGATLDPKKLAEKTFDICIVGAGAVGIAMAHRLYRRGLEVVVLESGSQNARESSDDNPGWGARRWIDPIAKELDCGTIDSHLSTIRPAFLTQSRTRAYGGSTNCWGGFIRPMDSYDFKDWPIKREDLQDGLQNNFYKDALALVKLSHWDLFDRPEAWNDLAGLKGADNLIPFDTKLLDSCGLKTVVIQQQTSTAILDFQEQFHWVFDDQQGNITLIRNATALDMNYFSNFVNHINCQALLSATTRGQEFTVKAKKFVLAMGGLEIPRFLLISQGKKNDLPPQIGHNYLNHPKFVNCARATFNGVSIPRATRDFYAGLTPLREQPTNQIQAYIVPTEAALAQKAIRNFRVAVIDDLGNPDNHSFHVELNMELTRNTSAKAISLSENDKEEDIFHNRKMEFKWDIVQQDIDTYNGAMLQIRDFFSKLSGKSINDETWWQQMTWVEGPLPKTDLGGNGTYTGDHHIGTCAMSGIGTGVVDRNCLISKGAANLYICSSAVFPTGAGWANSTLTLLAIALRLADHLKSTAHDNTPGPTLDT
ncbi:MAG TPA: FAD-dependent oxidoreductase [Oculatellaceae cyanobacterium]